jgi:hypothetical protein
VGQRLRADAASSVAGWHADREVRDVRVVLERQPEARGSDDVCAVTEQICAPIDDGRLLLQLAAALGSRPDDGVRATIGSFGCGVAPPPCIHRVVVEGIDAGDLDRHAPTVVARSGRLTARMEARGASHLCVIDNGV